MTATHNVPTMAQLMTENSRGSRCGTASELAAMNSEVTELTAKMTAHAFHIPTMLSKKGFASSGGCERMPHSRASARGARSEMRSMAMAAKGRSETAMAWNANGHSSSSICRHAQVALPANR